jgi:hypothetical protein
MKIYLLLILLFILPLAYAEISISDVKYAYNLGDFIEPKASVSMAEPFNGFLKAVLTCGEYTNDYYKVPVSIEKSQTIELFPLKAFEAMKGSCKINIILENQDKSIKEEKSSEEFLVTDELIADMDEIISEIKPGETLFIKGKLLNIRDEPIPGSVIASLSGEQSKFDIPGSNFTVNVKIPSDIKSGENDLYLSFEDKYKNYLDKIIKLDIIPEPTKIEVDILDVKYLPYEEVSAAFSILDQAGDTMDDELDLTISKDKKEIYKAKIEPGLFKYKLDNTFVPGKYSISASYKSLSSQNEFEVSGLQKIVCSIDGQNVKINNAGNINYKNTTYILIIRNDTQMQIEVKLSLKPSESQIIDLSKELPAGTYSILLPDGQRINDVAIQDNRGVFKKLSGSSFTSISGNAVKDNPKIKIGVLLTVIVIIVTLSATYYYGFLKVRTK